MVFKSSIGGQGVLQLTSTNGSITITPASGTGIVNLSVNSASIPAPGSNTQLIYNNGGILAGAAYALYTGTGLYFGGAGLAGDGIVTINGNGVKNYALKLGQGEAGIIQFVDFGDAQIGTMDSLGGLSLPTATTMNFTAAAMTLNSLSLNTGTTGGGNFVLATGPTMTNPIVGTQATSDNSTKGASTAYVTTAINNAIAGVNPAVAVQAATAAVLPNSPTYSNGVAGVGATLTAGVTNTTLVVDGYTPALNARILVKNQASAFQNGVYFVSQVAAIGLAWILTRALDYNQPSDINNTGAIPVINGTVNTTTSWVLTSSVTTVGTDALTYTEFSLNPTTLITTSTTVTFTISGVFIPDCTGLTTIALDAYAGFAYTIVEVDGIATSAGTITAAFKINGTNITSLSAISVTSTPQNVTATGANSVSSTNRLTLVLSSNASALNMEFTIKCTRLLP